MSNTIKILTIDDEPINLSVIEYSLSELPIELTKAYSGEEALIWYRMNTYHLIITDFNMPRKSGKDVLDEIRALDQLKNKYTPIILVTALDHIHTMEYKNMGFDEVLYKPINKEHLREMVKKLT